MRSRVATTLVIRRPDEMRMLLQSARRAPFRVELAHLSAEENLALERRLRGGVSACGCSEGSVGLLLGVAFDICAWALLRHVGLVTLILVPLAMTVGGKLFGLWRGRRRLRRVIAEAVASSV